MIGRGIKYLLVAVVLVELVYVVVANIALNSQWVQDQVNGYKPERFQLAWHSGWTVWPLQLHIKNLAADGQTHSKQWQIDASKVVGRLQLWPLLQRRVSLTHVSGDSVDFRLRAQPDASHEYSAIESGFPVIRGRDPTLAATPRVVKPGKGWQLEITQATLRGSHALWLYHVNAHLSGVAKASINYTSRGGTIEIKNGSAKVEVDSLKVGLDGYVTRSGSVTGSFSLAPYVRSQHAGVDGLKFLTAQAEINMEVAAIDFVNIYLRRFEGVSLTGTGSVQGRAYWQQGDLVAPTKLSINASSLQLNAQDYRVNGSGQVVVEATETTTEQTTGQSLQFGTTFNNFVATRNSQQDQHIMLKGDALSVVLNTDNHMLLLKNPPKNPPARQLENPLDKQIYQNQTSSQQGRQNPTTQSPHKRALFNSLLVKVPRVSVPDLKTYQAYLPSKWPLTLNGGAGFFQGEMSVTPTQLDASIDLSAPSAAISLKQVDFSTGMKLNIKARGSAQDKAQLDLSGTQLALENALLSRSQSASTRHSEIIPWHATLKLADGRISVIAPNISTAANNAKQDHKALLSQLNKKGLSTILSTMNSDFKAGFLVSDIGWINQLFKNNLHFGLAGSGEAQAQIAVREGWLAKGSSLSIKPKDLSINVLDYAAQGEGGLSVTIEKGGRNPDVTLKTDIVQGQVWHIDDDTAVIDHADIHLTASASNLTMGNNATLSSISIQIPKAKVLDVSAYNVYLPPSVPVKLLTGNANMTANVNLTPNDANGQIKLTAEQINTRLGDQLLSGKLDMNVNIVNGNPKNRSFDIDDSVFKLYDFGVEGEQRDFRTPGWAAQIKIVDGQIEWTKPMGLQLKANIAMADSRPFVAIMANQLKKHGWLEKLATVEDVEGEVTAQIDAGQLRIPYAHASSDKVEIGAKGLFTKSAYQGVLFARYRKLRGILKLNKQHRNFDVIGATRKFNNYSPPLILAQ